MGSFYFQRRSSSPVSHNKTRQFIFPVPSDLLCTISDGRAQVQCLFHTVLSSLKERYPSHSERKIALWSTAEPLFPLIGRTPIYCTSFSNVPGSIPRVDAFHGYLYALFWQIQCLCGEGDLERATLGCRAGPATRADLVHQESALGVLSLWGVRGVGAPQCPYWRGVGLRQAGAGAREQHASPDAALAQLRRVQQRLGGAADLPQLAGDEGGRLTGHGRGGPAPIHAVEVAPRVLPPSPSNAAEEAFDLLDGFAEHSLAEEDVDPRVQDGVHRGNADGLQVRVLPDILHRFWPVQLVHEDTDLPKKMGEKKTQLHNCIRREKLALQSKDLDLQV